jgi:hypothetical protein
MLGLTTQPLLVLDGNFARFAFLRRSQVECIDRFDQLVSAKVVFLHHLELHHLCKDGIQFELWFVFDESVIAVRVAPIMTKHIRRDVFDVTAAKLLDAEISTPLVAFSILLRFLD